jgi:hypothetical protein
MSPVRQMRDDRLVEMLATGYSVAEAAAAVGCAVSTIYRKLSIPGFAAKLAAARAERWRPRESRLLTEFDKSVDAMIAIRDDETVHNSTRLRAAQAIAELALRVSKVTSFDEETAKLQHMAARIEAQRGAGDDGV